MTIVVLSGKHSTSQSISPPVPTNQRTVAAPRQEFYGKFPILLPKQDFAELYYTAHFEGHTGA